tara:strand:- start:5270 stop:5383 length:114 start_codon:yes stop_codon:yes gene_type:complete
MNLEELMYFEETVFSAQVLIELEDESSINYILNATKE